MRITKPTFLLALLAMPTVWISTACSQAQAQEPSQSQSQSQAQAQAKKNQSNESNGSKEFKESDYYAIRSFEIPPGVELEATSFQRMPDGRMAVASRRGEVWMIEDPLGDKFSADQFKRFAHGLHEPIGMDYRDGWLYVTQRPDVSRLKTARPMSSRSSPTVGKSLAITTSTHLGPSSIKRETSGSFYA